MVGDFKLTGHRSRAYVAHRITHEHKALFGETSAMTHDIHKSKIRALVVADSPFMGMQIAEILNDDEVLEVVGRASDGIEALKMVEALQPDAIAMDLDMHKVNGITALQEIMVKHSVPTVVIGSLAKETSELAFDALRFGAVEVIAKTSVKQNENLESQRALIVASVKRAAAVAAETLSFRRRIVSEIEPKKASGEVPDSLTRYVCISAFINGYYCLMRVIPALPRDFADVLIGTIPAAPRNVEAFVNYLDKHSAVPVRNLRTIKNIKKGTCYLCSIGAGLVLESDPRGGLHFRFRDLQASEEPGRSSDRLMSSLARLVGPRAVGLVVGHGGPEGVAGTEEIRRAGGIGQVIDITDWGGPALLDSILAGNEQTSSAADQSQPEGKAIPRRQDCRVVEGQTFSRQVSPDLTSVSNGLGGYVNGIDIVDYLQFVLLTGRPTVLEVFSENGVTGQIYVRNGRVLHAQYGDLQGDQALYRCLASRGGSFLNRPWREPLRISINKPGELVLTEATQRRETAHREWVQAAN